MWAAPGRTGGAWPQVEHCGGSCRLEAGTTPAPHHLSNTVQQMEWPLLPLSCILEVVRKQTATEIVYQIALHVAVEDGALGRSGFTCASRF